MNTKPAKPIMCIDVPYKHDKHDRTVRITAEQKPAKIAICGTNTATNTAALFMTTNQPGTPALVPLNAVNSGIGSMLSTPFWQTHFVNRNS